MSQPAIEVTGLSKRYVIEHESRHDNLRDQLHHTARKLWRRARWGTGFEREEFWALRDVSFSVQPGEVVGIIGRNGAGKSTLLKILSRITEPTSGKVELRGRVASLLEVGTGFHPDLTGRENIFLNGAILGMSRAEIREKFDEIVAFAEVERFLDTPVKRYSSGMYVRLAFAVAAHLEPEILIVDEVLAVGDAQFQKKCLGKMQDVARNQGRTVLFVSHNLSVVSGLCARCLWLDQGRVASMGPTNEIIGAYYQSGAERLGERVLPDDDPQAGNARARLRAVRVLSEGTITSEVRMDRDVVVEYDFDLLTEADSATSSIHLHDKQGVWVLCSGPEPKRLARGRHRHAVTFPARFLNDGLYTIGVAVVTEGNRIEFIKPEVIGFNVNEEARPPGSYTGPINGCIRPELAWTTASVPNG